MSALTGGFLAMIYALLSALLLSGSGGSGGPLGVVPGPPVRPCVQVGHSGGTARASKLCPPRSDTGAPAPSAAQPPGATAPTDGSGHGPAGIVTGTPVEVVVN